MSRQSKPKGDQWIDLTDMLVWSGHYTGIQRVTYEYAKRFEADGAKFFAYDAARAIFFEVSLSEVVAYNKSKLSAPLTVVQKERLRRRIRRFVGTPYYRLNDSTKAFLHPYVNATNHTIRSFLHFVEHIGKNDARPEVSMQGDKVSKSPNAVTFHRADTVILLGAGWNEMRVLQHLTKLKKKTGFTVLQHINDILPIYQPHLFASELPRYFLPYVKLAIETADIITVISEATKRDVDAFCGREGVSRKPFIKVVRLGDNPQSSAVESRPDSAKLDSPFILSVGTFEIRKNYQLLYQAVKLAELQDIPMPKIVIVGRPGWLTEDLQHILANDPFVKTHVIWLNDISDGELKWLYKNCMFTVFPSLAEGWGLPVAESLGYGKMCIASGVSSMLEIGEGLVDYFLPYDARECMNKIIYYSHSGHYKSRNKLVKKTYKIFSWDDSYQELLGALER